jgi:hypothetical protein
MIFYYYEININNVEIIDTSISLDTNLLPKNVCINPQT